jgi:hypothetical protein
MVTIVKLVNLTTSAYPFCQGSNPRNLEEKICSLIQSHPKLISNSYQIVLPLAPLLILKSVFLPVKSRYVPYYKRIDRSI